MTLEEFRTNTARNGNSRFATILHEHAFLNPHVIANTGNNSRTFLVGKSLAGVWLKWVGDGVYSTSSGMTLVVKDNYFTRRWWFLRNLQFRFTIFVVLVGATFFVVSTIRFRASRFICINGSPFSRKASPKCGFTSCSVSVDTPDLLQCFSIDNGILPSMQKRRIGDADYE